MLQNSTLISSLKLIVYLVRKLSRGSWTAANNLVHVVVFVCPQTLLVKLICYSNISPITLLVKNIMIKVQGKSLNRYLYRRQPEVHLNTQNQPGKIAQKPI